MQVDYTLLETQGYVVLPGFLNSIELEPFTQDYRDSIADHYVAYKLRKVSINMIDLLCTKIKPSLRAIQNTTNLSVDLIIPLGRYYHNQISAVDCYHQDHDSFYILQQYYNYLNFWIPIIKPDANKSGLTIIPWDKLKELTPEYADMIYNYGATRYFPNGNTTKFVDDNTGKEFVIPCNLDSVAVSPTLNAGDAVILRGDTIHKTQDHDTDRVAISIRCTDGSALISKNKLFEYGCNDKQNRLSKIQFLLDRTGEIFETNQTDTITANEHYASVIEAYNNNFPSNPLTL